MKEGDNNSWIYDYSSAPLYKKSAQVNQKTYALYFCDSCKHVWEISCTGTIIRYKHMPSWGLKRIDCTYCVKGHNKPYKKKELSI